MYVYGCSGVLDERCDVHMMRMERVETRTSSSSEQQQWESERREKRASGLLAVLRWLGGGGGGEDPDPARTTPTEPVHRSPCDSSGSSTCGDSTDTAASFSYVPAGNYRPYGGAEPPLKYISPAPETGTYRARVRTAEERAHADRQLLLTLRTKYRLGDRVQVGLPTTYF